MLSKMKKMPKMPKMEMMKSLSLCPSPKVLKKVTSSAYSLPDVRVMVVIVSDSSIIILLLSSSSSFFISKASSSSCVPDLTSIFGLDLELTVSSCDLDSASSFLILSSFLLFIHSLL